MVWNWIQIRSTHSIWLLYLLSLLIYRLSPFFSENFLVEEMDSGFFWFHSHHVIKMFLVSCFSSNLTFQKLHQIQVEYFSKDVKRVVVYMSVKSTSKLVVPFSLSCKGKRLITAWMHDFLRDLQSCDILMLIFLPFINGILL